MNMEQRAAILIHLIENIRVPLDTSANLATIGQAAHVLLGILFQHHNLMLARLEVERMPKDEPNLIALSIVAILVEGSDYRQKRHIYCLEEMCNVLIDYY